MKGMAEGDVVILENKPSFTRERQRMTSSWQGHGILCRSVPNDALGTAHRVGSVNVSNPSDRVNA